MSVCSVTFFFLSTSVSLAVSLKTEQLLLDLLLLQYCDMIEVVIPQYATIWTGHYTTVYYNLTSANNYFCSQ